MLRTVTGRCTFSIEDSLLFSRSKNIYDNMMWSRYRRFHTSSVANSLKTASEHMSLATNRKGFKHQTFR